jgi:hypothetical protein
MLERVRDRANEQPHKTKRMPKASIRLMSQNPRYMDARIIHRLHRLVMPNTGSVVFIVNELQDTGFLDVLNSNTRISPRALTILPEEQI